MKVLAQFQVVFFLNILTLTACTVLVSGQLHNDTLMFPFGTEVGDIEAPATDDGSIPISTSTAFKFFNSSHNQLFVNVNGAISFVKGVDQYTPKCGALDDESAMVAPYWADVDLNNGGNLYMRESKNESLLRNAESYIKRGFPDIDLTLNWLYVVTWHKVAMYRRSTVCGRYPSDIVNTFQVVLATDGTQSFVLIFYKTLRWTTGTNHRAGGGNCAGLGGTPAKAGFDLGDGATFYDIQGSCTDSVLDLVTTSNIDVPGAWIFQVDSGFANYTRKSVEEFEFAQNTSGMGVPMCSTIPPIRNGAFALTHYMAGSVVKFTCDLGFRLIGPDSLTCLSVRAREAAWNGDIPRCESGQNRSIRTTQRPDRDLDCKPYVDSANSSVIYVREGCSLTLNCNTHFMARRSFYTDKMIKWYKDDLTFASYSKDNSARWQLESIPTSGVNLQTNQSAGHKIVLTDVSQNTAGTYECEAMADSAEFKLLKTVHFVRILAEDEHVPTRPPSPALPTTELTVSTTSMVQTTELPVAGTSIGPTTELTVSTTSPTSVQYPTRYPISTTTSVPQNSSDSPTIGLMAHINELNVKVQQIIPHLRNFTLNAENVKNSHFRFVRLQPGYIHRFVIRQDLPRRGNTAV